MGSPATPAGLLAARREALCRADAARTRPESPATPGHQARLAPGPGHEMSKAIQRRFARDERDFPALISFAGLRLRVSFHADGSLPILRFEIATFRLME